MLACGKHGSVRANRASWVKRKLLELYEVNSIHGLPTEFRVPALYALKLEREASEHSRVANAVKETA